MTITKIEINEDFQGCVNEAIFLLDNFSKRMQREGYDFNINLKSCVWAIEQAITNRFSGETMLQASRKYVESVKYRVKEFNGIQ